MKQRRFFEAKGEESGEWLVLDGKRHPPRVICKCIGWNAPKNAALIVAALQAHNAQLYSKFPWTIPSSSMSTSLKRRPKLNLLLQPGAQRERPAQRIGPRRLYQPAPTRTPTSCLG